MPINTIPVTDEALLIRTDFSDQAAWEKLLQVVRRFKFLSVFNMALLDEPANQGATAADLLPALPPDYPHSHLAIADARALQAPDFPVLVVDLLEEPGRTFRAQADQLAIIDDNLAEANMDFEEFAAAVDKSGVFRGF
jgi:hypothetical protein